MSSNIFKVKYIYILYASSDTLASQWSVQPSKKLIKHKINNVNEKSSKFYEFTDTWKNFILFVNL